MDFIELEDSELTRRGVISCSQLKEYMTIELEHLQNTCRPFKDILHDRIGHLVTDILYRINSGGAVSRHTHLKNEFKDIFSCNYKLVLLSGKILENLNEKAENEKDEQLLTMRNEKLREIMASLQDIIGAINVLGEKISILDAVDFAELLDEELVMPPL